MKRLTKLTALLAFGLILAGCGETSSSAQYTDQELVDMAATTAAIAVFRKNGEPVNSGRTNTMTSGDITLTTSLLVRGTAVTINWTTDVETAFTFENPADPLDTTHKVAKANYPIYDKGATPLPDVEVELTGTAVLGTAQAAVTYELVLKSREVIPFTPLGELRGLTPDYVTTRYVRGFVTRFEADWNIAYIQEGDYAVGLFKLQLSGFANAFKIGDYIEVEGFYAPYNGLAEIASITAVRVVEPPEGAVEPTIHTLVEADWSTANLQERMMDGALVRIEGLTFVKFTNRDGDTIPTLPQTGVTGKAHGNVVCMLGETEVTISVSYHIDSANQTAINNFFVGLAAGATFTYEGILGWYNAPVLSIVGTSDLILAA